MKILLDKFIDAIKAREGWFAPCKKYPKGSRSWRNRNCGNLRYVGQKLATGKDKDGFAIFATEENGRITLKTMIINGASGKSKIYRPSTTIRGFFRLYAPSNDGNDPDSYATYVAKQCGLDLSTPIRRLLE